jgi:membrane protein implicated in regulation of membrane protease activity
VSARTTTTRRTKTYRVHWGIRGRTCDGKGRDVVVVDVDGLAVGVFVIVV